MSELPNNPECAEHEPDRLPTFIISVGTQVVLKSAKRVPGTDLVKPVGSVAEVLEAPARSPSSPSPRRGFHEAGQQRDDDLHQLSIRLLQQFVEKCSGPILEHCQRVGWRSFWEQVVNRSAEGGGKASDRCDARLRRGRFEATDVGLRQVRLTSQLDLRQTGTEPTFPQAGGEQLDDRRLLNSTLF